ncbi:kynureninase [Saccharopolyspora sp. NPDC002376]
MTARKACADLDTADPLAPLREEFVLPESTIYLDGNSLGPLPRAARERVLRMVDSEWGQGLIRSWNDADWFDKPAALGERVASVIGAEPSSVVVCDSTSINLFKVFTAALALRPGRDVVVAERDSFPTDLYMMEGATALLDGYQRRLIGDGGPSLDEVLDDRVAVVVLSHVDYRTGALHDMAAVTEQIQQRGALVVWDLCHSAGALPIHLARCNADFAIGCTYKYLNGGPGSPAFVYVAPRHQDAARQPLSGWNGHADPFAFAPDYRPASGIDRFRCGTPPLLSYAPLEEALELWRHVDLDAVRAKSVRMTSLFVDLVDRECAGFGIEVASPRDPDARGSQVSLRHESSYPVMQALIDRNVIGDFRAPDLMRFGFTPLYLRYVDVWDAVVVLRDVLSSEVWRSERYATRGTVT